MAVSNAIGSNIFDILVGLGLPFLIVMSLSGGTVDAGGDIVTSVLILFGSVVFTDRAFIGSALEGRKTYRLYFGGCLCGIRCL